MVAYTSTQTGNFSAAATWGGSGSPADGDTFTVSAGHTVTIDTGISVPASGYGDSNIFGILQNQANANTTLRMNGRLFIRTNGTLHLRDGARIEINGSSAEQHGIWQENETGASVIMEGSDGMPSTTLSANTNEGSTALTVANAANFAVGEWFAVFDNTTTVAATNDHNTQHQDEGFWIHDISSNTIYFRIFGGPDDVTITRSTGSTIIVSNSKVFRVGQKIIFGTGANRNIKTITAINYSRHAIICDSSITGTVTNQTVYLTGTEKFHGINNKIRKVATVTTQTSSTSATTITVANANMFSANDEIWIEHRSEADGTTDYQGSYDESVALRDKYKHTVSSVSGNTITLSEQIGYTVVAGALVTRMTRNIICTTVATDGSDYAFYYNEYFDSNYNKKLILKDVYFKNFGNDDSNVQTGVVLRGFHSTDNLPVTITQTVPSRGREPWIEGIVVHNYPENTHRNDWGGLWLYDTRYAKARCVVAMNGDEGISAHFEPGCSVVNCIVVAPREWAYRLEGSTEWYEFAYNYASRCRYGIRYRNLYEQGLGTHDFICDAHQYGIMAYDGDPGSSIYRSKFTGLRFGMQTENSSMSLIYCKVKTLSGLVNSDAGTGTPQAGAFYVAQVYRGFSSPPLRSLEHNYEYDAMSLYGYNWEAKYDHIEQAWRFFRRYDNSNNPGMMERIFIPANTTVRLSCKVKLSVGFSGTYPFLIAVDLISGAGVNRIGNTGGEDSSQWAGKRYSAQYTVAAASAYEEKQITIVPKPYPRTYMVGVLSNNADATEGFWIKNMRIYLNRPYANPFFNSANDGAVLRSGLITEIRNTFTEQKKRIGGRIG